MNLKAFSIIGGFDENLFIDGVDIDYCYAAMTKGFNNIIFKTIILNMHLENLLEKVLSLHFI